MQSKCACAWLGAAVWNVPTVLQVPIKDHVAAMETVMDFLSRNVSSSIMKEVVAVGHRCAGDQHQIGTLGTARPTMRKACSSKKGRGIGSGHRWAGTDIHRGLYLCG
jgi:hypothetical protein